MMPVQVVLVPLFHGTIHMIAREDNKGVGHVHEE